MVFQGAAMKEFPLIIGIIFEIVITLCSAGHVLHGVGSDLSHVEIECNSNNILVTVETEHPGLNAMIYPRGLAEKNSSCLKEYEHIGKKLTYKLPLRSCNTMAHDLEDGKGIEYFNTVVIQPHSKLVTSEGKGFTVRCRYQTKNVDKSDDSSSSTPAVKPVYPALPNCMMKIYVGGSERNNHKVAEHVKIGQVLTLVIKIDEQDTYGLKVTNCIVKDGLSKAEQPLINNEGCPIDQEIFGNFEYSTNLTLAQVSYPAHRFPSTSSVYYACNVKLCNKKKGECDDVPPICDNIGNNIREQRSRKKRDSEVQDRGSLRDLRHEDSDLRDRSVEVFSGLYVNEEDDTEESDENTVSLASSNDMEFCVSTRRFSIAIAVAGLILTLSIILLVACIVHRRRRRKGSSTAGSSIYSGPYSNHAYSRD